VSLESLEGFESGAHAPLRGRDCRNSAQCTDHKAPDSKTGVNRLLYAVRGIRWRFSHFSTGISTFATPDAQPAYAKSNLGIFMQYWLEVHHLIRNLGLSLQVRAEQSAGCHHAHGSLMWLLDAKTRTQED
jgi:hypothetical protein